MTVLLEVVNDVGRVLNQGAVAKANDRIDEPLYDGHDFALEYRICRQALDVWNSLLSQVAPNLASPQAHGCAVESYGGICSLCLRHRIFELASALGVFGKRQR